MAKRRANSEGSVYRRANGTWEAKVSLQNGRRQSLYGKTHAEALSKMKAALRRLDENLPLSPERLKVKDYLEDWHGNSVSYSVSNRTFIRYGEIVHLHLIPRLGHIRLVKLKTTDVERSMREALNAGQSPRSALHHRAVLRTALNHAIGQGMLIRNVAALAKPPRVPEVEHDPITPGKARAIIQAVKGHRLEPLYLLMLATGLREGEAIGLKWPDLNLDANTLRVQRVLQRVQGDWLFKEPKTQRSRRTISLPSPVTEALRRHHTNQLRDRLRLGHAWEDLHGLVFTKESGSPLTPTTVSYHFHRLLGEAGLPRMRIHDLRHGAASLMAVMGIPPRVAMELLGHSQIATTMNVYSHVASEYGKEAMDRIGDSLWG